MEEDPLQFRRQSMPRDREATVRGPELGERVGHRLTYEHERAGCEDHEGEQEGSSRFHENTTTRKTTTWPRRAAFPLIDATEGPKDPIELFRSTSRKEPGSFAHETFKVVTTLASVCVALRRVPFGPI